MPNFNDVWIPTAQSWSSCMAGDVWAWFDKGDRNTSSHRSVLPTAVTLVS
ncbi:MAG: hypothetical protein PUD94_08210 [Prevotellaceae bacterium]|nr:hypothetical protein [Prevotellaceae bacterium]